MKGPRISHRPQFFKGLKYRLTRFVSRFERSINLWSWVTETLAAVASVACIVCLVVYAGFDLSAPDRTMVWRLLRLCQVIFGINILYQLIMRFSLTMRQSRIIKWIVDVLVLLSLAVWMFPDLSNPWFPTLKRVLFSHTFLFVALGSYALVDISYAISHVPSRRTNPSLLMGLSFLFFILIGSFVLMLPKCTYHGISFFDSLFVSSSAVCITGLSTVDIPSTFTPLGLMCLTILVQLGSLGIITFTSFFALFFTGNTSIYNQLLLRDIIYSKSMNSLIPTLLYVLGFTVVIELVGTVCVFFTVPDALGLDLRDKLVFSAFHSMSSFCNAGFSCVPDGMANPAFMNSNQNIYLVTSVLIFAGAVGFPILVNFKEIIHCYLKRAFASIRGIKDHTVPLHIFDLNTKIVLYTTLAVLVIGTVSFFCLEYHNTLEGMSTYKKVVQSLFNSLIPRSAGFASVNPASFLDITLLLVLVQMVIGGASQSMAGGIKVNTLGAVILNLGAVLRGHDAATAFHRTINRASIRRANAVITIAALSLLLYTCTIMLLEPAIPTKSIVFEVVSAVFTVGSSLGATPLLGDVSKVVLSTAMFFGRVGIISILSGLIGSRPDISSHYPVDNIIIN